MVKMLSEAALIAKISQEENVPMTRSRMQVSLQRLIIPLLVVGFSILLMTACTSDVEDEQSKAVFVEASDLCEAAFGEQPKASEPTEPILLLKVAPYQSEGDDPWVVFDPTGLDIEPAIARMGEMMVEPGTRTGSLVCIIESRNFIGFYEGAIPGYQLQWSVLLVNWDDGSLIDEKVFDGVEPPLFADAVDEVYGEPPVDLLVEWLNQYFR
jgi:hypothetical protein